MTGETVALRLKEDGAACRALTWRTAMLTLTKAIKMMNSAASVRAFAGVMTLAVCGGASGQTIVAGPLKNAANEHRYQLISASSWASAQSIARSRGGDLATINDAAENDWVTATFTTGGKKFFIGLNDAATPGAFSWSDGSTSAYRNWDVNQPGTNSDYVQLRSDKSWATAVVSTGSLYLVEIAGPIRVPQEYSDINDAFGAMNTLGVYDLEVGNAIYSIPTTHVVTVPTGKVGSIRGAGIDKTRLRLSEATSLLDLRGSWDISGVELRRIDDASYVRFSNGRVRISDSYLTCSYDAGSRLVVLGPSASLEMRRSTVGRSRGGPVFTAEGPGTVKVTAMDSLFNLCLAITSPNIDATISSCTLHYCGLLNRGPIFNSAAALTNTLVYLPNTGLGDNTTAEYCAIPYAYPGLGNVSESITLEPGTYRPADGSRLINAGSVGAGFTSGLDRDGNPRVADGQIDIGAYEFQPVTCDADFNRDGFISFDDFDDFVRAFEAGC